MSRNTRLVKLAIICSFWAIGAAAQAQGEAEFAAAANGFTNCLTRTVQMGMTTKMDPATFKEGFAKSCRAEEQTFRAAAIKFVMANGRTEAAAIAEVDGNIANGRRVFAADQESYVKTGKVPN